MSIREWLTGVKKGFRAPTPMGHVILLLIRGLFGALVIGIATGALYFFDAREQFSVGLSLFCGILLIGILVVIVDMLARHKEISVISAVYFGLIFGFLLSQLLWTALEPVLATLPGLDPAVPGLDHKGQVFATRVQHLSQLFLTLVCIYVAISVLIQTKDEFRFIIPYVEFARQLKGSKPLVLDTSVIIDGRIADICDTGIIDSKLIVPRFVLQELQGIADSSDKIKRNRGRRGLDVLKRMQNNAKINLQIHEANLTEVREVTKVDERLVAFAKSVSARVVTNDFNLNKIAQLQGVDVINLNELANALKLVALPGENLQVKIVKQGDQIGQGVGYLDDGTMIVVEQGRAAIGQEVTITVTSVLQTPAGRMIFGRIEGRPAEAGAARHATADR